MQTEADSKQLDAARAMLAALEVARPYVEQATARMKERKAVGAAHLGMIDNAIAAAKAAGIKAGG